MSICVLAAGQTMMLAASAFTLSWIHSIERIEWQEDWRLTSAGLVVVEARIKGTGAGMEPPDDARLEGGWWRYVPALAPQRQLNLAVSDIASKWRLCTADRCLTLGQNLDDSANVRIQPCAD